MLPIYRGTKQVFRSCAEFPLFSPFFASLESAARQARKTFLPPLMSALSECFVPRLKRV